MIQLNTTDNVAGLAESYGFSLEAITPPSKNLRLDELQNVVARQDVPFPIESSKANSYLRLAQRNLPFGIGSLTDLSVDLGDYSDAQRFDDLGWKEHLSWANLVRSQQLQKHRYASQAYLEGERKFKISGYTIPDYYLLNARIYQQTGWQLATVNEIIPANVFFHCHSRKFFPVTTFMRPLDVDYLEEPDIGHDIAGHVATFTIPQVAWIMNQHGLANDFINQEKERKLKATDCPDQIKAIEDEADELLLYAGRIYWFTVEFGLVLEGGDLKAFGAGILSSPGETRHSIESDLPNRIVIDVRDDRDLLRLATTDYLISEFQKTYFVMRNFESLESLTAARIIETVTRAVRLPHYTWREIAAGDDVFNVGREVASPNEKYLALSSQSPLDECMTRTAKRNLKMWENGFTTQSQMEQSFIDSMPSIPN